MWSTHTGLQSGKLVTWESRCRCNASFSKRGSRHIWLSGVRSSRVPELPGSGPVSSVKLKCPGQTAVSVLSGGSTGAFAKVATKVCWGRYFQLFSVWARHVQSVGDSLMSQIYFNKLLSCTVKLRWILLFETVTHFQRPLIEEGALPKDIWFLASLMITEQYPRSTPLPTPQEYRQRMSTCKLPWQLAVLLTLSSTTGDGFWKWTYISLLLGMYILSLPSSKS